jgi:hypothetical protein
MNPDRLVMVLRQKGITLEPKLRFTSQEPLTRETLELMRAHRDELLTHVVMMSSVPRLPWQLERLISAASNGSLPKREATELEPGQFVMDLNQYVLAWAAAYLTGDREEALAQMWKAHRAWQGVN